MGCPAICRDDIKEGMALATSGFVAGPGDELTARTVPVFFGVIDLLLRAGVTTVAEAAFADRVWRPRLEPLRDLARIRVVHCEVSPSVAAARIQERRMADPSRRVHADQLAEDVAQLTADSGLAADRRAFDRVQMDVPSIEVDTTDGYQPEVREIAGFALGKAGG